MSQGREKVTEHINNLHCLESIRAGCPNTACNHNTFPIVFLIHNNNKKAHANEKEASIFSLITELKSEHEKTQKTKAYLFNMLEEHTKVISLMRLRRMYSRSE